MQKHTSRLSKRMAIHSRKQASNMELAAVPKINIEAYEFKGFGVRVVLKDGNPWWVAKDVAEALGYKWDGTGTIQHVPEEWRGIGLIPTPSGEQNMAIFSEQGLYFFLARSNKPRALPFQKWIAGEVLPSIRKTGMYSMPQSRTDKLLLSIKLKDEVIEELEKENKELKVTVKAQQSRIEADKDKVEFAERVLVSEDVVSLRTAAKLLKLPYGGTILAEKLRDKDIPMEQPWNIPYQQYVNQGYFVVDEVIKDVGEKEFVFPTTRITQAGLKWLSRLLKKKAPSFHGKKSVCFK